MTSPTYYPLATTPDISNNVLGALTSPNLRAPVVQLVDRWTCDLKVSGSNPRLGGLCGIVSIFSAPYAVPVFQKRHKTNALSQSPNVAGSLTLTLSFYFL